MNFRTISLPGRIRPETKPPVAAGVHRHGCELHHPRDEGRQGGTLHLQARRAQVPKNKHPVERRIGTHGYGKYDQPQTGVSHAAVGPHVDAGEAVEEVGGTHDAGISRGNLHQRGVIRQHPHELSGKESHGQGKKDGDGPRHITANPHDPVDTLHISFSPILAD